jgi:hypothetical protein
MKLVRGFKLFQPWANEIVTGIIPILVRSFNTNVRGRVAVIASRGIDKIYLNTATEDELMKANYTYGAAIGSVEIIDSIPVEPEHVLKEMEKRSEKKAVDFYPKHLIPYVLKGKPLFLWMLKKPKKWKDSKKVEKRSGILWAKIDMEDE